MNENINLATLIPTLNHGTIEYGTPNLAEKLNLENLQHEINNKNIDKNTSSKDGLTNYKYSKLAGALRNWNNTTCRTRGLVTDETNTIIARGYNKFFNLSEVQNFGVEINLDEPGLIMDKLDGSLGLVYKHNNTWRVSTAGSLTSDQAIHATNVMNERYANTEFTPGKTMLVEIIYPDNKIVTNYGTTDDLYLLGGADTNGYWIHPDEFTYAGPRVEMKRGTIRDTLNTPDPEDGTEGFVIRLDSGLMVKIKYPKYLQLHRAKFMFSEKKVWEALKTNSFTEMLAVLPDEFHDEAKTMKQDLENKFNTLVKEVDELISQIPNGERKDRAIWVNTKLNHPLKHLVMAKGVGGSDIDEKVWERIKP